MGDWGWCHLSDVEKTSILDGLSDGGCHGGPFHAEIQLTDRCNLACGFCCTRRFRGDSELSLAEIGRIARELKSEGCRSVTLNGGGEPLRHANVAEALQTFASAGLSINHLTTNGTLLSARVAALLIAHGCEQVIVSLNAGTADDYARLMGASPRQFQRVKDNIRTFVAMRRAAAAARPEIVIQFLVHAGNIASIPDMYRTAIDLGVDKAIFNDITGREWAVRPASAELAAQVEAYRAILQEDRERRIASVHSHNVDIAAYLEADVSKPTLRSRVEKIVRRIVGARSRELRDTTDCCITPWHSMTIRPTGEIPVCCALQDRVIDRSGEKSIADVWHGAGFARVRQQIRRSIVEGEKWRYVPKRDTDIVGFCGMSCARDVRCRFRSFYFSSDGPFLERLKTTIDGLTVSAAGG